MASVSKAAGNTSTRVHRNLERAVLMLTLLAGLPGGLALLYILWQQQYSFEVRWTVATVVGAVWIGCGGARLPDGDAHPLPAGQPARRAAGRGLLDPRHRRRGGQRRDLVMQEINALGDTLQRQRTEAVESTRLLHSVMAAIDVAVFAFDMDAKLVLVNPAAERLIGQARRVAARARGPAAAAGRLPRRRDAAADRTSVRPGERPPRAAAIELPP